MKVSVLMGSASDLESLREMISFLREKNVQVEVRALSAHRTPKAVIEFIEESEKDGVDLFIAAAGKAAHLPGVVAGHTIKPVIGIPVKASTLDGLDALLSIVQMPKGVPVATVAIDGGFNAGVLALQILAVKYDEAREAMKAYKKQMEEEVLKANSNLNI